jgi:hypothetical protein
MDITRTGVIISDIGVKTSRKWNFLIKRNGNVPRGTLGCSRGKSGIILGKWRFATEILKEEGEKE